jgi:hypothetical protein
VDDQDILHRVASLVDEEHRLRGHGAPTDDDRERLAAVEVQLDQCWDLLRQRQARRDAGTDPGQAQVRPPDEVESYLQ